MPLDHYDLVTRPRSGKASARFGKDAAAGKGVRAQGKAGAIAVVYQCAFSAAASVRALSAAAKKMSALTRMGFAIAGCALGVAAVGGLVVCLSVLLL